MPTFEETVFDEATLRVAVAAPHVAHVELNRPKRLNAMNPAFWADMRTLFTKLGACSDIHAVVISGAGRLFTSGLDLMDLPGELLGSADKDVGRRALVLRQLVADMQASFTVLERIPQPVIVAVHGACIGGGIDLITAADVRFCTTDAWFTIKEVDIGLAADVGTLQRISRVVASESWVREKAFTADRWDGAEAHRVGLVSRLFATREEMVAEAVALAARIATKSPIAVIGTKRMLLHARDHPVDDSLAAMATWNMAMLQSDDLTEAVMAGMEKRAPRFAKL